MELAARCVSGGVEIGGSGFGKGSGLGGGDGNGEWSGVIGVVGIFLVDIGSSTSGGELAGSLENRFFIIVVISWITKGYQ